MGFEYGYSITNPNTLTIWEAQFGDFANGAQIIIDNYLTSGESKWVVQNGLVLNLPHGNDGQGPEHSSARVERYLQMMNDSWTQLYKNGELEIEEKALRHANMSVICCSTAHGIFHSLRRQLRRDFRKPLISIVNKKLLKMKDAMSTFSELAQDNFDTILQDDMKGVDPKSINKIVLLTGQAYYAVSEKMKELGRKVTIDLFRTLL
jgi:2-oxoglutarate dehydrogenase E1 component